LLEISFAKQVRAKQTFAIVHVFFHIFFLAYIYSMNEGISIFSRWLLNLPDRWLSVVMYLNVYICIFICASVCNMYIYMYPKCVVFRVNQQYIMR
jgi:hypothetical protein